MNRQELEEFRARRKAQKEQDEELRAQGKSRGWTAEQRKAARKDTRFPSGKKVGGPRYEDKGEKDLRSVERIPGETEGLCTGHTKHGDPCLNWAMHGTNVCRKHGGATPQVRAKAQQRLDMASARAAGVMVEIMEDKKAYRKDRIAAAKEVLDRAGITRQKEQAATAVNVNFEAIVKSGKLLIDLDDEEQSE